MQALTIPSTDAAAMSSEGFNVWWSGKGIPLVTIATPQGLEAGTAYLIFWGSNDGGVTKYALRQAADNTPLRAKVRVDTSPADGDSFKIDPRLMPRWNTYYLQLVDAAYAAVQQSSGDSVFLVDIQQV